MLAERLVAPNQLLQPHNYSHLVHNDCEPQPCAVELDFVVETFYHKSRKLILLHQLVCSQYLKVKKF